jgi:predicted ester cyclase
MGDDTVHVRPPEENRPQDATITNDESSRDDASEIDLYKKGDITWMMARAGSGRLQPMRGFDEDYTDIVDYIVRCTHKIWDEGGMGLLYSHYAHNSVVHTPYGTVYGREQMLTGSINTLSAFSDRQSFADDVIWSGNDEEGFHTSHRVIHLARNNGHSVYGPPTGRRIKHLGIANCFVKENLIHEEWLVRDALALVRQLGLDENEVVDRLLAEDERRGVEPGYGHPERVTGQTEPPPNPEKTGDGFEIEEFILRSQNEIWNWRLFNKITDYYAPNYLCYTSSARTIYGIGDFRAYVMAFIVAFPDCRLNIDHLYWLGNDRDGYRVASRWTLIGTHDGPSMYGTPTGKPVNIMGITHHVVKGGRFVKEWTVFDELALLKQLRR